MFLGSGRPPAQENKNPRRKYMPRTRYYVFWVPCVLTVLVHSVSPGRGTFHCPAPEVPDSGTLFSLVLPDTKHLPTEVSPIPVHSFMDQGSQPRSLRTRAVARIEPCHCQPGLLSQNANAIGGLYNRNSFLTILETDKSKIRSWLI